MPNPDHLVEHLRWSLSEYGHPHDDPELDTMEFTTAQRLLSELRKEFEAQETAWASRALTSDEIGQIGASLSRWSVGIQRKPSDPLVSRPFTYSDLIQRSELPSELRRKLLSRGLDVTLSPVDRHYIILSALRDSRIGFTDEEHEHLVEEFAQNRPFSDELMIAQWGKLPPDVGDELLETDDTDELVIE